MAGTHKTMKSPPPYFNSKRKRARKNLNDRRRVIKKTKSLTRPVKCTTKTTEGEEKIFHPYIQERQ